eukprot:2424111-Amphidinium_carterae.2
MNKSVFQGFPLPGFIFSCTFVVVLLIHMRAVCDGLSNDSCSCASLAPEFRVGSRNYFLDGGHSAIVHIATDDLCKVGLKWPKTEGPTDEFLFGVEPSAHGNIRRATNLSEWVEGLEQLSPMAVLIQGVS